MTKNVRVSVNLSLEEAHQIKWLRERMRICGHCVIRKALNWLLFYEQEKEAGRRFIFEDRNGSNTKVVEI